MRRALYTLVGLPLATVALATACGPSQSSTADGAPGDPEDAAVVDAALADAEPNVPDADPGAPTGEYVYLRGDFVTAGEHVVARMDLGNRALAILPLSGLDGGTEISGLAVSPDGETIAVAGNDEPTSSSELQLYPADGSGSPVILFTTADSERRITSLRFSPDGNWVAFLADSELLGARALHVVPVDASAPAKRVSLAPVSASQDVSQFAWAPDSLTIAFLGDLVTNNVEALWTVNATVISPTPVEIVGTTELGSNDVQRGLGFDSQGRLYFRTNLVSGDSFQLFRAGIDGSNRQQVPGTALANDAGEATISAFRLSPDGTRVAFASESPNEETFQVFVLDLSGMAPARVSAFTPAPAMSGARGPADNLSWSPSGDTLTMTADWQTTTGLNNDFGVFVLPASGAPGGIRIAAPTAPSGDAFAPRFSQDGTLVVFTGDMLVDQQSDLFVAADLTTGDQDLATLRAVEAGPGGTIDAIVVAPQDE